MRVPAGILESTPRPLERVALAAGRLLPAALALGVLIPSANAQGKPDQVHVWNARRGETQVVSGTVTEDGLQKVTIAERGGRETKKDSLDVRRVVWGDVPASFSDGMVYLDRGDYENAVAKLRSAATDSEARDVVKAAARCRAVEALMGWGASDPSRFTEAVQEADRFVSAYADNRHLPLVRELKARATLLTGDHAAAGALFRALFDEWKEPTESYDFVQCARAGLSAGHALLAASTPDTLAAREVFSDLDARVSARLAELEETDPAFRELNELQDLAQLADGYVLLASSGQANQAQLFFKSRLSGLDEASPAVRFSTLLGLGLSLEASGEHSQARLEFAKVAALDHTGRDRVAKALLGLARCYAELQDTNGWNSEARKRLTLIRDQYGDTTSARKARELLETLN